MVTEMDKIGQNLSLNLQSWQFCGIIRTINSEIDFYVLPIRGAKFAHLIVKSGGLFYLRVNLAPTLSYSNLKKRVGRKDCFLPRIAIAC